MKRDIALNTVRNLRTLAGLPCQGGTQIRPGVLLRSAALNALSPADGAALRARYGVDLVVDLRTNDEVRSAPDALIPGVSYLHLPVCADRVPGISREVEPGQSITVEMLPDMRVLYRGIVSDPVCLANWRTILRTIVNHRSGAVLWHCTAGKDRCGLTAYFIETLLGVDERTRLADYLRTNRDARPTALKYLLLISLFKRAPALAKKVHDVYIADRAYLAAALEEITASHGSVEAFLRDVIGITEAEQADFRAYALEQRNYRYGICVDM